MKICQIYNSAAHYREAIFKLIDKEFDSDYLFGRQLGSIKQMDTSKLRGNVTLIDNHFFWRGFYWQPGVLGMLKQNYEVYLMLGDTRCISTWLFCILAKLFYRKKRIYFWTHGWYGKESIMERWLKKFFFRMPNGGIFLYGNYARELMIKEGFDGNKLYVIHNSLAYDKQLQLRASLEKENLYQQYFGNSNHNLVFIGRLTKVKQLDMILLAVALLKEKGHRYNVTLIGDGDVRRDLEVLTEELGLQPNVWFYGACYDEERIARLIYNSDLCVSPGNIGLTAVHSLMFGTPVITHDDFTMQMPEFEAIHDGETGTFFHRGDVKSLADGIEHWFATKGVIREIVRQACFHEIDTLWTPQFQINVLKRYLK